MNSKVKSFHKIKSTPHPFFDSENKGKGGVFLIQEKLAGNLKNYLI